MTLTPKMHIVIVAPEGSWGHTRPMCAFASRLVHTRPVYVTFFGSPRTINRIKAELSRFFTPGENALRELIRVIALDITIAPTADPSQEMMTQHHRFNVSFAEAYATVAEEQPVICAATGIEYPAVLPPTIVLVDIAGHDIIKAAREISKIPMKVYCFVSGLATFGLTINGPEKYGGLGDLMPIAQERAAKTGKTLMEVIVEIFIEPIEKVLHTPGLPSMHFWEHSPQDCTALIKRVGAGMWFSMRETFQSCDGQILASPEIYEPEAIAVYKEWFATKGRPVWAVGPLLPLAASTHAIAGESTLSENAADIKKFMDGVFTTHGEKSMLYISFGSVFWPPQPEKLETFLEVAIGKRIPFILSHGSPFAAVSDSLKAKVEAYSHGLLSPWSPQQTILNHPALGWFVTHGGHNSVLESIFSAVPLICWPHSADQAANAILCSETHDIAYELIEVRSGGGLLKRHRTGIAPVGTIEAVRAEANQVLDKAFGEDGARKRLNVKKLQEAFYHAWDQDGSATKELNALLDTIGA